eukprot:1383346-Rhodomonas_salina.3
MCGVSGVAVSDADARLRLTWNRYEQILKGAHDMDVAATKVEPHACMRRHCTHAQTCRADTGTHKQAQETLRTDKHGDKHGAGKGWGRRQPDIQTGTHAKHCTRRVLPVFSALNSALALSLSAPDTPSSLRFHLAHTLLGSRCRVRGAGERQGELAAAPRAPRHLEPQLPRVPPPSIRFPRSCERRPGGPYQQLHYGVACVPINPAAQHSGHGACCAVSASKRALIWSQPPDRCGAPVLAGARPLHRALAAGHAAARTCVSQPAVRN